MLTAPTVDEGHAGEFPAGIVCRQCGKSRWKVTRTRQGRALIRRWRTCLECDWTCRTAERIEAESHPERDAA